MLNDIKTSDDSSEHSDGERIARLWVIVGDVLYQGGNAKFAMLMLVNSCITGTDRDPQRLSHASSPE